MASDSPSVKSDQALTPNKPYTSLVTTNRSQALYLYVTTNTTDRSQGLYLYRLPTNACKES